MTICERCGKALPPSTRRNRRFCSDTCRKASARAEVPLVVPTEGPVTAAVSEALAECTFGAVDGARSALALALARLVDGGSVPAAAQLRGVLDDLGEIVDDDTREFLASIRTPVRAPSTQPVASNGVGS